MGHPTRHVEQRRANAGREVAGSYEVITSHCSPACRARCGKRAAHILILAQEAP